MRWSRLGLVVVALLAAMPGRGTSLVPATGWIPNSAGLPPFVASSNGRPALIHNTLRIAPHTQGRMLAGHALYGLWHSVPGAAWTTLTPHCLTVLAGGLAPAALPGCGVNGIATDGLNVYISTFNLRLEVQNGVLVATIDPGGIWKSEIRVTQNVRIPTAGLVWRRVLAGVRGNALAVRRAGNATTIVAGRIQQSNVPPNVGVDNNPACAGCSPSVYTSFDDGTTWQAHTFTGGTCADKQTDIGTSSRLVGNLSFDPIYGNVVYAAANSGLWVSANGGGAPWTLAFGSCGNAPGFAVSRNGRAYVGRNSNLPAATTSTLWTAVAGGGGPGAFGQVSLVDAATLQPMVIDGWTQTILPDARDATGRTLYVAAWRNADPFTRGQGGVYKVLLDQAGTTGFVTKLRNSLLENCGGISSGPSCTELNQMLDNPLLPYPLIFDPRWGPSTFLAQHQGVPDLLFSSSVLGGVWTRSLG